MIIEAQINSGIDLKRIADSLERLLNMSNREEDYRHEREQDEHSAALQNAESLQRIAEGVEICRDYLHQLVELIRKMSGE